MRYRDVVSDTSATSADGLIRAAIDRIKLTDGDRFIDEAEHQRRIGIRVSLRGSGRARGEK